MAYPCGRSRTGGDHDGALLVIDPTDRQYVALFTGRVLEARPADDGRVLSGFLAEGGLAAVTVGAGSASSAPTEDEHSDPAVSRRAAIRVAAPHAPHASTPDGLLAVSGADHELTVHHRLRETGLHGEAPFVEEWKPLLPRLHQIAGRPRASGPASPAPAALPHAPRSLPHAPPPRPTPQTETATEAVGAASQRGSRIKTGIWRWVLTW